MQTIEQGWYDIPNDEYHNGEKFKYCMTSSGLKELAKSPMHWYNWRMQEPTSPTAAQIFGTLYHMLVLEPDTFDQKVCVYNGRKAGKDYQDWLKSVPKDGHIVSVDDYDKLLEMKSVLDNHLIASSLTDQTFITSERTGFFKVEPYSFYISIRPDILNKSALFLADVKTCQSAQQEEFSKTIANFKYHWQAWLYLTGARILDGAPYRDWLWLCQEKTPPYAVACYRATDDMLALAEKQVTSLFDMFEYSITKNVWPSYFEENRVVDIELPYWAFK